MRKTPRGIGAIWRDRRAIERALRRAVFDAIEEHRRAGNPISTVRDGKVVWIQPKDIPAYLRTGKVPKAALSRRRG